MKKKSTWIQRLRGQRARTILLRAVVLLLLVDVAFIFLMPVLRMISTSLMHVMDL